MAQIITYPKGTPKNADYLLGTSTPAANTDDLPVTKNFAISDVSKLVAGGGAKVYIAKLTNLGAGAVAPVATVIENTIGDIVWTRTGVGSYVGTLAGAFTENKTFVSGQNHVVATLVGGTGSWPMAQSINSNNADTVSIYNYALNLTSGNNLSDDIGIFLEIKVYE